MVLVSGESDTTFNSMFTDVVGASVFPEPVVAPLQQVLDASKGSQFIMGRVAEVDFERQLVTWTTQAGTRRIPCAQLAFTLGMRANLEFVPRLAQNRHGLGEARRGANASSARAAKTRVRPRN